MSFIGDLIYNVAQAWEHWLSGFLPGWLVTIIDDLLIVVGYLVLAILFVLIFIWLERKLVARLQDRLGPNRVGPYGLVQPIADTLKLLTKEVIIPEEADGVVYRLAPILVVLGPLVALGLLPIGLHLVGADLNVGIFLLMAFGSITEIAVLMAGWSSNNKYALLGAFRSVAQLVSYEVPMVLAVLAVVILSGSMSMQQIVLAQKPLMFLILMPTVFLVYFLSANAELARTPFDLLEAESELIAGYHIEYSGMAFALFYLAEYINLFVLGGVATVLFLGGWRGPFAEQVPILGTFYFLAKDLIMVAVWMWIRGTFPRFRIDHMLSFAWKVLVPVGILLLLLAGFAVWVTDNFWIRTAILLPGNLITLWVTLEFMGRDARRAGERDKRMALA
jgi:NADH-quinone oxidoreductase subunit H